MCGAASTSMSGSIFKSPDKSISPNKRICSLDLHSAGVSPWSSHKAKIRHYQAAASPANYGLLCWCQSRTVTQLTQKSGENFSGIDICISVRLARPCQGRMHTSGPPTAAWLVALTPILPPRHACIHAQRQSYQHHVAHPNLSSFMARRTIDEHDMLLRFEAEREHAYPSMVLRGDQKVLRSACKVEYRDAKTYICHSPCCITCAYQGILRLNLVAPV